MTREVALRDVEEGDLPLDALQSGLVRRSLSYIRRSRT